MCDEKRVPLMERIWGGHCEILGFGVSGKPLLPYLLAHGAATVTVRDQRSLEKMQASGDAQTIADAGATLVCGDDYLQGLGDSDSVSTVIFRSPGLHPDLPEIAAAVKKGAMLTSDTELFLTLTPARVWAITGSDGKTTTTTIVSKLLELQAKKTGKGKVYLGGNIGISLIPDLDGMTSDDIAVMELSSFQLMTMGEDVNIHTAIITNITPNHLNWHTDYDEYITAKTRVLGSSVLERIVLNAGNEQTYGIGQSLPRGKVVWFSAEDEKSLPCVPRDALITRRDGQIFMGDKMLLDTSKILLPGDHNVENYMAAIGATHGFVDLSVVAEVAETFPGVDHRLRFLREYNGARFYNSSIDSTPSRTCAALRAMRELRDRQGKDERGEYLYHDPIVICGGQDKHIPFDALAQGLCRHAKAVVLTGEAREQILDALETCPLYDKDKLPVTVIPDYVSAMKWACEMAKPRDVVLLSPACTSFDAFTNFAERGQVFAGIVAELGTTHQDKG